MGAPKTVRLDDFLEEQVGEYLKKNALKFSQLVKLALEKFISEPQAIELTPISKKEWQRSLSKAYKKHKHAMDKLK